MEIMSSVATMYKDVLQEVAKYSSNERIHISTNPNNCQNIAQHETKAVGESKKKDKKRGYEKKKDKKDEYDSKQLEQDKQAIQKSIDRANKRLKAIGTNCKFSYSDSTKEVSIKIYEKGTNKIIREIASDKILDVLDNKVDFMGLFIDNRK